ncbi:Crp/Fnr family transcriptional regulator [Flavobacterium hiemivividum]|uniref:Crp/Fnr family transcriptional regulator n=1 Tax=Flavobacterium hiemivividum TaxID=2541734 RepID=A0A4R5CWQ5_9FLAO|nr:Crp/Fnr family transcriptional regulator [Flavobacterium hiemivividum]TDE03471.1 Crp/Fnr family transcriptional regulator [Flavobacterium hiemivividum]
MEEPNEYLNQFIQHLKETIAFNESEEELIVSCLEIKYLKKKESVLEPGEVSNHMRYIAKGSMRVYHLDENTQEQTLQLGVENWWVNDLYSYLSERPSRMFIQAIESAVLVQISKSKLEILFVKVPQLSNFFRLKMQKAYVVLQERTMENLSLDSFEKYEKFRKDHRNLEQRFPQYIIASYLGMTPEFLSYLRKKHSS